LKVVFPGVIVLGAGDTVAFPTGAAVVIVMLLSVFTTGVSVVFSTPEDIFDLLEAIE